MSRQPPAKTPLRILCLGDSLTAGYMPLHPYSHKLTELLGIAFPHLDIEIEVDGVPGDSVAGGGTYLQRMAYYCAPEQPKYDWTIVLGGTNDLTWCPSAQTIFEALRKVWDLPLARGGKVLGLTVPETKFRSPTIDGRRNTLNEAIKAHKQDNFYAFDLHKAVPYHAMDPASRPKYWDMDGVHFTEAGYDLIGQKIAGCLIQILRLAEAQETDISSIATSAKQRRQIEEMIFDEEMGNPKLLSQGYIIVRKKDLD